MRWPVLAAVSITLGCNHPSAGPSASGTPSVTATGPRPDEHGPPEPVSMPSIEKACATGPCGGEMAKVTVWRDGAGKVRTLELAGDIRQCSHPPTVFFDAGGNRLDAIPMKPVVPGSEEANQYQAIRDKYTRGLSGSESHYCQRSDAR